MSQLTEAQKVVARTHGGGDYAHFADMTYEEVKKALPGCGDTLFAFLMYELAAGEGCEDLEEAQRRVEQAMEDMQEVFNALSKAEHDEQVAIVNAG